MSTLELVTKHPAVEAGCAEATRVTVWRCRCKKCGNKWETLSDELPAYCPGCRKDEWWIKRPRGRPSLKLRPDIWVGRGPERSTPTEENTRQWVTDTPSGEMLIRQHEGSWLILRQRRGRWVPDETLYPSAGAAVEAIETEIDEGKS